MEGRPPRRPRGPGGAGPSKKCGHWQNGVGLLYFPTGVKRASTPVAERAARECLSLPIFPELTDEQIEYVAAAIREFKAC
ncbi:MAG TPA: DegT/DnrJ/EryC1/StrS family aminotransferase [Opitutaceae bacterium]|nr:DegT/DnrJ/EryC1/StrS family aminotransferase [Opitutaceae bacterium]